jgi:hypothetical protein
MAVIVSSRDYLTVMPGDDSLVLHIALNDANIHTPRSRSKKTFSAPADFFLVVSQCALMLLASGYTGFD